MNKIYTRKVASIILALTLIIGINSYVQAQKSDATKVYITSMVVDEGQIFSVPITITKPEEYLAAFDFWLSYDNRRVEVLDIVPGIVEVSHNISNDGEIRTAYVDFEKGLGFQEEGTLFTIKMKAKSRVEGNFLLKPIVYDFYNSKGSPYEPILVEAGEIQVQLLSNNNNAENKGDYYGNNNYNNDSKFDINKKDSEESKVKIERIQSFDKNIFNLEILSKDLDPKEKIEIKITLTPQEMSKFKDVRKVGVYKLNEDGNLEYKGGWIKENELIFSTSESGVYLIKENDITFKDIDNHWAKEYIEILASRHIAQGTGNNNFDPSKIITRGEFTTFLGRAFGLEGKAIVQIEFKDIDKNAYYAGYVNQLYSLGIIQGYGDGKFRPEDKITREEMITLIMRLDKYLTGKDLSGIDSMKNTNFIDENKISNWAKNSIVDAYNLGFIEGRPDGSFGPDEYAQRGDIAKLIVKLLEKTN